MSRIEDNGPEIKSTFQARSAVKAADREHRRKINFNIGRYDAAVPKGKAQYTDLMSARERAKNRKWKALENLDRLLEDFEAQLLKRGAKVIWAEDVQQAQAAIRKICAEKNCKTLVKSKSMVTEEIHLNDFLQTIGVDSVETDLGDGWEDVEVHKDSQLKHQQALQMGANLIQFAFAGGR